MSYAAESPDPLGFHWEHWFEHLRRAESTRELGSLGGYQLLEEVARGGQGVVFRAREQTSGRIVAVKRLLAGSFATRPALRRFEREVEAASALSHPGIVSVLRFEMVEGSPLLAMEWIEGVPITRWASGKGHVEILARFLAVCDAVQHAHQRGVLHRDLKPSNVLVDPAGCPHVLDFGLAKRTADAGSTITESGEFLGTPAYAAPEQWRGEELDLRADVYSLGALLFEMLTGRRVVEGDAIVGMARALERREPPHASLLAPAIPRELDAILVQALASESAARYQSVDALSADLRRFLSGEPVLAHTPSSWQQVRKLVARNRAVSASLAALLLANLVYLGVLVRQSRRLSDERDGALLARNAEGAARADAQREATAAREAEELARRERARADEKAASLQSVFDFFLNDVVNAASPDSRGADVRLVDALSDAAAVVPERFAGNPLVESQAHYWLAEALSRSGSPQAELEVRLALEINQKRSDATVRELADAEYLLAAILHDKLEHTEAEHWYRQSLAHREEDPDGDPRTLRIGLQGLGGILFQQGRSAEALEVYERAAALDETEDDRATSLGNQANVLFQMGRQEEALAMLDSLSIDVLSPSNQSAALFNRGTFLELSGEVEQAEQYYLEALALGERWLGPVHPDVCRILVALAEWCSNDAQYQRAREYSERAEQIARHAAPGGLGHACALIAKGHALRGLGLLSEGRGSLQEGAEMVRKVWGAGPDWENRAVPLAELLLEDGRADEAESLLAELARYWQERPDPGTPKKLAWLALRRAEVAVLRAEDGRAVELFEESIRRYSEASAAEDGARATQRFAEYLRSIGDLEGAADLEAEAARAREGGGR